MNKKISPRHNNAEVIFVNNMTMDVRAYFNTLPAAVRTAIVESGAKFDTVEQLKVLAESYMNK